MSGLIVDRVKAREALDTCWSLIDKTTAYVPPEIMVKMERVLKSDHVAFRYILVTGLLGKHVNSQVHARAVQKSSTLEGAYDARSLCHKVLVRFEKEKGYLYGLSNEPIAGKAARHKEHDKTNSQLKNKKLASDTHDVLEYANTCGPMTVKDMLIEALRIGKERGATQVVAEKKVSKNLKAVIDFCEKFLEKPDGGARLVAVVGAFVESLKDESTEVRIYPPNQSDKYAKVSGDIEVHKEEVCLSAYECKHRGMNLDDVTHGITKARENGVQEYIFVHAAGLVKKDETEIEDLIEETSEERDVMVIDVYDAIPFWAAMLNPSRREHFGTLVAEILLEDMKRDTSANEAATLWNSLK
jgi:hypothetical protein